MGGFGICPGGAFAFGFGCGDAAPEPPNPELSTWGSRFINAGSGDYEYNSTTRQLKQMPGLRQRFLIKLTTVLGSNTVLPALGVGLPRKIDQSFERKVDNAVRIAMRQETDVDRVARIDSVSVVRGTNSGRVTITVAYTDLETGSRDTVVV
jgi:phage baseplate assembly protein W